jgi:hypothetical protein
MVPGGPAGGSSLIVGMLPPGVGGRVWVGCSRSKKLPARSAIKTILHTVITASVAILILIELSVSLLKNPSIAIIPAPSVIALHGMDVWPVAFVPLRAQVHF